MDFFDLRDEYQEILEKCLHPKHRKISDIELITSYQIHYGRTFPLSMNVVFDGENLILIDPDEQWKAGEHHPYESAMHIAAEKNHLYILELLLELGAYPEIKTDHDDSWGETPLHIAASKGHIEIICVLFDRGVYIDVPSGVYGRTELHHAIEGDHLKAVKMLLKAGADPNICHEELFSPLETAITNGNIKIMKCLLDAGADPHQRYFWGKDIYDAVENYYKSPYVSQETKRKILDLIRSYEWAYDEN